jgi:site-specific recombinase XerD
MGRQKRDALPTPDPTLKPGESLSPKASPPGGLDLADLMQFDLLDCRARNLSQSYIELTQRALRFLHRFLKENGLPTGIAEVSPEYIRSFKLHLLNRPAYDRHPFTPAQKRKLGAGGAQSYLRAARAAFNRWRAEGLMDTSPFQHVPLPKAPRRLMPVPTLEELRQILAVMDTATAAGLRDLALVLMYLDTACRLSEITGARLGDLDMDNRSLVVMGKGGRERMVFFGYATLKTLWKYLKRGRPAPADSPADYLFLTLEGQKLTRNRIYIMLKKYARKAGVDPRRISPHSLRRAACSGWVRNHGDLISLQSITGHADIGTLERYVRLDPADVKEAHRRYGLVDNLLLSQSKSRRPGGRR